ncbi:MAG: hypothetical protein HDR30_06395 [Lachnospiraceae bacterium]|nr:hypothetical protein [Lachnospiraceae bacterium]
MNRKIILHCMTAIIILLIIPCLMCGCSSKVSLDEETQAEVDEDATHAEEDAMQYLSEKYDMDFELKSFEPYIFALTSDTNWLVRSHYARTWKGEFIVDGETYTIIGHIPLNKYVDDYQLEEIQTAYTELMQQYFADVCEVDGVECKVEVVTEFSSKNMFSVYYDGTNFYDCLKDKDLRIEIDITDAGFSEELLRLCENSVVEFEKDYEGAEFSVIIIEGKESMTYSATNFARFDYDKWINSEYYGTEGITLHSLKEYIKSENLYIYK